MENPASLFIYDVPKELKLTVFINEIEKNIGKEDCVVGIVWTPSNLDKITLKNAQVNLESKECAKVLFNKAHFDVSCKGRTYKLKVTRSRSSKTIQPSEKSDASSSSHAVANGDVTGQEKAQLGLLRNEGKIVSANSALTQSNDTNDMDIWTYPKPFEFQVDTCTAEYLRNSPTLAQALEKHLEGFANLTVRPDNAKPDVSTLVLSPVSATSSGASQGDFDSECSERLNQCLQKLTSETFESSIETMQQFKDKNKIPDNSFWLDGACHLKWKLDRDPGKVIVTGKLNDVETVLKYFKELFFSQSSGLEPTVRHASNEIQDISASNSRLRSKSDSENLNVKVVSESHTVQGSSFVFSSRTNQSFSLANKIDQKKRPGCAARVCLSSPNTSGLQRQLSLGSRLPSHSDASSSQRAQLIYNFHHSNANAQELEERSGVTKDSTAYQDLNLHVVQKWSGLLEKDPQLFSLFENKCVVVSELPQEANYDEVRSYFEESSISGGGKVKKIIRIPDGYLIAFADEDSVAKVRAHFKLSFKEKILTVFSKRTPLCDDRLFFFEGDKLNKHLVQGMLVGLGVNPSCFYVKAASRTNKILIILRSPGIDIAEIRARASKYNFKTKQVCRSDVMLISQLSSSIRNEDLIETFKDMKCDVTYVKRKLTERIGLVYFSDFRDVEKILDGPPVSLGDVKLNMSYYVSEFGQLDNDEYLMLEKQRTKNRNVHKQRLWNELLEEEPQLFSNLENNCIVVNEISQESNADEIRSYFEDTNISKGGKVEQIIRISDGHLIVFRDEESVEEVLALQQLNYQNKKLKVFSKQVPLPDDRLLFVEGNDLTKNTVERFLLSLSGLSRSSFLVKETKLPQKFLITFESEIEFAEVKERASKENIKTHRLCQADMILLLKVSSDIGNTEIEQAFSAKKYTVTHVKRNFKKDCVMVYFDNFRVVPEILDGPPITIGEYQLKMFYYIPGIGRLENEQYKMWQKSKKAGSSSLSTTFFQPTYFRHEFPIKKAVAEFFTKCKPLAQVINEELTGIAESVVEPTYNANSGIDIVFSPCAQQSKSFQDQKEFDEMCRKTMENFFRNYKAVDICVSVKAAGEIKLASNVNKENFSLIKRSNMQVLIKWNKYGDGVVSADATGMLDHVDKFIENISEYVELFPCSPAVYENLERCGILKLVEAEHHVTIYGCCKNKHESAYYWHIQGSKPDVKNAKKAIQTQLKDLYEIRNFRLDKVQQNFLIDSLRDSDSQVEKKINTMFQEKRIKASLQLKEMTLYCMSEAVNPCLDALQSMIEHCSILLDDDINEISATSDWLQVKTLIEESKCLILNKEKQLLTLMGLEPFFSKAKLQIVLLNQSNEKHEKIEMSKVKREYIRMFSATTGLSKCLKEVEMETEDDGIHLVGKRSCLKKTVAEVQMIEKTLKTLLYEIEEHWKKSYLLSAAGKQFIETLQKEQQCLIMYGNEKSDGENQKLEIAENFSVNFGATSSHYPTYQNKQYPAIQLPDFNVTVQVVKGNITKHQVDAIVNASNQELELRSAGVSGCIKREGGNYIQHEMDVIRSRLRHQKLQFGNAVTTGAGLLSCCRKIIHVAGPVWKDFGIQRSEPLLRKSVMSCLDEAVKHGLTSIAIPAISCGVFGGDPDIASRVIVHAIADYFASKNNNKKLCLQRVDLIELASDDVLLAMSKYLIGLTAKASITKGAGISGATANSSSFHVSDSSHQSLQNQQPSQISSSCKVEVEKGNLLASKTDVILCPVGSGFEFEETPISKTIAKKAGKQAVHNWYQSIRLLPFDARFHMSCTVGKLSCLAVVHLIASMNGSNRIDDQAVSWDLCNALKYVEKMEMQSIALPAIGAGKTGLNGAESCRMIQKAIEMFQETNPKHLKIIKVMLLDTKLLDDFQMLESKIAQPKTDSSTSRNFHFPSLSSLPFSPFSSSDDFTNSVKSVKEKPRKIAMVLTLCSSNESIFDDTIVKLERRFQLKYGTKRIDKVSCSFKKKALPDDIKQNSNIIVEILKSSHDCSIVISGLSDDVTSAQKKINAVLRSKNLKI